MEEEGVELHPLVVGTLARDRIERLMEVGAAERRAAPVPRSGRRAAWRVALGQALVSAGARLMRTA